MLDVKTIKCKLTSSDGGQLLFGRLKDELVEQFLNCHNNKSPFVGINAPDIRDWSEDTASTLFLKFKGVKKSAEEGDFSSVLVVEEEDGNTVEVDLSLVQKEVEEELQPVEEDGFYFLCARWGSCAVSAWNASIEGSFDPKKLLVKVKKSPDSFLNFRTVDEKILLGSGNYIYSIVYDGNNVSDAVDHEIYDLIHNELNFERVSRVLCIMQVRNKEKSIVYYFDESRDAEKYLPLIEKATLVNKDDDPWDPDTRHKVCDFVSLENPHDTNSDWQEHDYPHTPVNDVKAPEPQQTEIQEPVPQEVTAPEPDDVAETAETEKPQEAVEEKKTSYLEEYTTDRLQDSSASAQTEAEGNEKSSDSFIDYLAAAQKTDDLKTENTPEESQNMQAPAQINEPETSMLDYLNDNNGNPSSYEEYSSQVQGTPANQSVDNDVIPPDEQNRAITQMLKSEPESEPEKETENHDDMQMPAEPDMNSRFTQTVSSGMFSLPGAGESRGTEHTIVMEGAKCPVCGRALADGDKFCGYCGNNLSDNKQFCTNCGTRLRPWANFCSQCGYPVKK